MDVCHGGMLTRCSGAAVPPPPPAAATAGEVLGAGRCCGVHGQHVDASSSVLQHGITESSPSGTCCCCCCWSPATGTGPASTFAQPRHTRCHSVNTVDLSARRRRRRRRCGLLGTHSEPPGEYAGSFCSRSRGTPPSPTATPPPADSRRHVTNRLPVRRLGRRRTAALTSRPAESRRAPQRSARIADSRTEPSRRSRSGRRRRMGRARGSERPRSDRESSRAAAGRPPSDLGRRPDDHVKSRAAAGRPPGDRGDAQMTLGGRGRRLAGVEPVAGGRRGVDEVVEHCCGTRGRSLHVDELKRVALVLVVD